MGFIHCETGVVFQCAVCVVSWGSEPAQNRLSSCYTVLWSFRTPVLLVTRANQGCLLCELHVSAGFIESVGEGRGRALSLASERQWGKCLNGILHLWA